MIADPDTGDALLPSVVALLPNREFRVGQAAASIEDQNHDATVVRSVKRYMGLGSNDLTIEDRQRYQFVDQTGSIVRFQIGDRSYTPPEISAEILRALKKRAEAALRRESRARRHHRPCILQ